MNYLDAISYGNKILKSNNIKNFNLESEILLAKALKSTREQVLINLSNKVALKNFNNFKSLIIRRKRKEPIAHIFRIKEFWKYSFKVNKNVLIPRPETEQIVEEILKLNSINSSKQVLDVGTGSGCIIISIIKERPYMQATAIDTSKKALKIAISNAKMHHLQNKIKFININVDKFETKKYDFIVSNPPYINTINLKRLDEDVGLYEPHEALKGGIDGLTIIKKIISKSKTLLKKNGKLIFEIGNNQKSDVIKLLHKNSFYVNKVCKDIQSHPRTIVSTKLI